MATRASTIRRRAWANHPMNEALVVSVRGVIGFFTLLIFTRLLGKQQLGQLSYFDYVVGITIGSIAASLTVDLSSHAWPHWIGLLTWALASFGLQWLTLKWHYASKYIDGEPTVVIMNGKIMEKTMRALRYRVSDLLEQLRDKDVFDPAQVEFAVLETNGTLSVLKKAEYQQVTPKDLNLPARYAGLSTELIYDGVIVAQNLAQVQLSRDWLERKLRSMGIRDPAEVFLATLDTTGNLYVDTYRDRIRNPVNPSDYPGPN